MTRPAGALSPLGSCEERFTRGLVTVAMVTEALPSNTCVAVWYLGERARMSEVHWLTEWERRRGKELWDKNRPRLVFSLQMAAKINGDTHLNLHASPKHLKRCSKCVFNIWQYRITKDWSDYWWRPGSHIYISILFWFKSKSFAQIVCRSYVSSSLIWAEELVDAGLTGRQGDQQNGSYSVIYKPGTQTGLWLCAGAQS